jgi:hypothetical protein
MSQPSKLYELPTEDPATAGDDDGMNLKLIVVVGVISLAVFAASAVVAWVILKQDNASYAAQGVAPQIRGLNKTEEIGMVDYVPFDADRRLENWTRDKAQKLNGYGWADRQKGLIHIPIDEAMKEVVRQASSNTGTPAGGGATK